MLPCFHFCNNDNLFSSLVRDNFDTHKLEISTQYDTYRHVWKNRNKIWFKMEDCKYAIADLCYYLFLLYVESSMLSESTLRWRISGAFSKFLCEAPSKLTIDWTLSSFVFGKLSHAKMSQQKRFCKMPQSIWIGSNWNPTNPSPPIVCLTSQTLDLLPKDQVTMWRQHQLKWIQISKEIATIIRPEELTKTNRFAWEDSWGAPAARESENWTQVIWFN